MAGVASPTVVVLEEVWQCFGAFGVRGEHLPVGPFAGESSVEPLGFAVLPRAMGLDEHLPGSEAGDDGPHGGAAAIRETRCRS